MQGGVIAQYISAKNYGLVPIVITLSSPILRPSIMFDYNMHRFYKNIEYDLNNTIIISLNGGYNDFLVPSYLTKGAGLNVVVSNNKHNSFHLFIKIYSPQPSPKFGYQQIIYVFCGVNN